MSSKPVFFARGMVNGVATMEIASATKKAVHPVSMHNSYTVLNLRTVHTMSVILYHKKKLSSNMGLLDESAQSTYRISIYGFSFFL